jgi:hypothetical protein
MLGQLLEKQGDRRAAAEQYRAALALAHSYTRAQENLKRLNHQSALPSIVHLPIQRG